MCLFRFISSDTTGCPRSRLLIVDSDWKLGSKEAFE